MMLSRTYLEHCLVDRIDKVGTWLQLFHCESPVFIRHIIIILQKHPVSKLHVITAWVGSLVHPAVLEGGGDPAPVQEEDQEVDQDGDEGHGHYGHRDYGHREGVYRSVINVLWSVGI